MRWYSARVGRPRHRADSEAEWKPGAKVGRCSLLAKLAVGGMAEIWLAEQSGLQGFTKLVVIKRILETFSENPEFVGMFLDEARIAAQLNHPNIVQIYDLGEHADAYYIAMEYLAGETLSVVVRNGIKAGTPLPIALAALIVSHAAAGLGHAHSKLGSDGKPLGIVHRDVSPQNLIITFEGNVKVVDFGIARAANRATRTSEGQIKGKMAYMAPEQATGGVIDARSDVFSLGVILFEATTGTRFYGAREVAQIIAMMCGAGPFPRAHETNAAVPESLSQIIDKALSRDPNQRYSDGNRMREALEDWLHGQPEKVGIAALERYLKGVLGEAWGKRVEFIESARAGLLTPSGLRKNVGRDTDVTMPGGTPNSQVALAPSPAMPKLSALIAGVVGALVLLLAIVWRLTAEPAVTTATVIELPQPVREQPAVVQPAAEPPAAVRPALPRPVFAQSADPPPRPVAAARGKLTLQTTPVTEVFIGSRSLGESPLIDVPLAPGKYTLRLVNSVDGTKSSLEVEIASGKTTVKKLRL